MKKRLLRWAARATLVGVALCVMLALLKDRLAKNFFQRRLRQEIGLEVSVEHLHLGLGSPTVALHNLKVVNSAEFGGSTLMDIPEVDLEYAPAQLFSGTVRLKHLRFHLAEVHIVRNTAGKLNVDWAEESETPTTPSPDRNKTRFRLTGIDQLTFTLGRVVYSDLQEPANSRVFELGVTNEVLTHVESEADFTNWLLTYLVHRGVDPLQKTSKGAVTPVRRKHSRRATNAPAATASPLPHP